jgi:pyruvate dehydrogenase E1 component
MYYSTTTVEVLHSRPPVGTTMPMGKKEATFQSEDRLAAVDLAALDQIQRRVLWLATSLIHHANKVREIDSGVKVGGHQASSASMVSIMTALYFHHLEAADRVSVKPHAGPVLHAINYLLGRLDLRYLTELRSFHGLQSYPSRTKDPDPVDFSTGSMGIGATSTIWNALAHRYAGDLFGSPIEGRRIALLGDAELDEGAIWEALGDPVVSRLGEVLWIVDVNRQSLDRVVPTFAASRISAMFEAAGWQTITLKYGHNLLALFEQTGGDALRHRIDGMENAEYQRLLRLPILDLRDRLPGDGSEREAIVALLCEIEDAQLATSIRDLGGHDVLSLLDGFRQADQEQSRPTVIFAYTIKAWGLPFQGHPSNHSTLLSPSQWEALAVELGTDPTDPWLRFPAESREAELCRQAAERLRRPQSQERSPPIIPAEVGGRHVGAVSTQQSFGRFFGDIAREAPEVARSIVTVSPDVASSTNLGTWINRVGIWDVGSRTNWFADDADTLVQWRTSHKGQHIELGIAETNLVGLLGELGTSWSHNGQPLLPIGTIYDSFVSRALEPWSFGMYAGGQSILIGTPSGVTLSSEGGAHQSVITPSIGLEQPGCVSWEPAFGQDLEWMLLYALSFLGKADGHSAYFRLSTRPIDQSLASVPQGASERAQRRTDVLSGGYVIRLAPRTPDITLVVMGAVLPEALVAAQSLADSHVESDVICLTSADLIFRAVHARYGLKEHCGDVLDRLFPAARAVPMVTVLDGHPHTLSFLGSIHNVPIGCLGVTDFGQAGDVDDLYRHFGLDANTIVGAALDLVG